MIAQAPAAAAASQLVAVLSYERLEKLIPLLKERPPALGSPVVPKSVVPLAE
jgi:hypothetical protein